MRYCLMEQSYFSSGGSFTRAHYRLSAVFHKEPFMNMQCLGQNDFHTEFCRCCTNGGRRL